MSKKESHFKVKSITEVSTMRVGDTIPESDLTIQTNEDKIYQFEFVDEDKSIKKVTLEPGQWSFEKKGSGLGFVPMETRKYNLLESATNTSIILNEYNLFEKKIDIYRKRNKQPKRSLLLYSVPGVGKTASINKVIEKVINKEKGVAVIYWDTASISSSDVSSLFLNRLEYHKDVKKLFIVIEDIGGGTVEEHYGPKGVDSSLLNLLDGQGNPFQMIPTFIIATTNNPEKSVGALIDRPRRFDKPIELKTPDAKEAAELLSFFLGRDLIEEEEKKAAEKAANKGFSIAHLEEVVDRHLIYGISLMEAVRELIDHKEKVQNYFQDPINMGI